MVPVWWAVSMTSSVTWVAEATSGFQALEWLRRHDAELAIVDLSMPGMSGLELNVRMKASGNPMPVIFMSGESQPHETQAAQDSGAVHFLWKPFNTREMLAVIDRVLSDTPGP